MKQTRNNFVVAYCYKQLPQPTFINKDEYLGDSNPDGAFSDTRGYSDIKQAILFSNIKDAKEEVLEHLSSTQSIEEYFKFYLVQLTETEDEKSYTRKVEKVPYMWEGFDN